MSETTQKLRPDLSRPFDWAQYKASETPVCTRDGRAVGTIAQFPECTEWPIVAAVSGMLNAHRDNGLRYRVEPNAKDLFFAETPRVFTDEEATAFCVNAYAGTKYEGNRIFPYELVLAKHALAEIEHAKRGEA